MKRLFCILIALLSTSLLIPKISIAQGDFACIWDTVNLTCTQWDVQCQPGFYPDYCNNCTGTDQASCNLMGGFQCSPQMSCGSIPGYCIPFGESCGSGIGCVVAACYGANPSPWSDCSSICCSLGPACQNSSCNARGGVCQSSCQSADPSSTLCIYAAPPGGWSDCNQVCCVTNIPDCSANISGGLRCQPAGYPPDSGINTAIGCVPVLTGDEDPLIATILRWAIGIAGGIAFLLIIYAGFQITTSTGHPEKIQAGKELLTAAIAGLMLIIFSIFLLHLVGVEILRLPGF